MRAGGVLAVAGLTIGACAAKEPHAASPAPPSSAAARAPAPPADAGAARPAPAAVEGDLESMLADLDEDDEPGIREIPRCLELRGADACTGVGKVMLACTGLANILREEPTERLLACLTQQSGAAALCEIAVIEDCAVSTITATAPTAATTASCRRWLETCTAPPEYERHFTQERCASGLAALRSRARDDFVTCMNDRCDLRLCVSGLL